VTARTVRIGIKVFFERRLGMRYLALVALLAFLAVPFMAGCDSGKTPAQKKDTADTKSAADKTAADVKSTADVKAAGVAKDAADAKSAADKAAADAKAAADKAAADKK
jgi:hypothetical protein